MISDLVRTYTLDSQKIMFRSVFRIFIIEHVLKSWNGNVDIKIKGIFVDFPQKNSELLNELLTVVRQ